MTPKPTPKTESTDKSLNERALEKVDFLDGDSWSDKVSNFGTRFKNGVESFKKEGGPWEKMFYFWEGFMADVEELTEEEKAEKEKQLKAASKLIFEDDKGKAKTAEEIAPGIAGGLVGSDEAVAALDADKKKAVDAVALSMAEAGLEERRGFTIFSSKLLELDPENVTALTPDEKKKLFRFGLKALGQLKGKFSNPTEMATALDNLDAATSGPKAKGLSYLKTNQKTLKGVLKISRDDFTDVLTKYTNIDATTSGNALSFITGGMINGGKYSGLELGKKMKAGLSLEEARTIQVHFKNLFPATFKVGGNEEKGGDNIANVLVKISEIMGRSDKYPSNQEIAELVFLLEDSDIVRLANILGK
ncbi:hypothetical protein HOE67_03350 [Candidatus Peregrinibacteria bacterium]|jgi:hypothetical protein|nr:hypothetical protein [Candidatus Peregrinibacteria bacterium]MBT4056122.1 hypothetical protein [Candidatus Peregrinibacteria bacterium]